MDIKNAILSSKNIYPDVISKSMPSFEEKFKAQIEEWESKHHKVYERLSEDQVF